MDLQFLCVWVNTSLSFFPKILLLPSFPGGMENTYCQFFRKLFNQFEKCLRTMIKVLEFYKKCASWLEVAAQLSLHFPDGKCVNWKNRKKNIGHLLTPFNWFSSNFYQKYHHLILVTDDPENVGHGKNVQKLSFLTFKKFLKELPKSNLADGNR